jgi:hypothetical protein
MDSTRFDALTRSLATASNRRAFLRTTLAAVAAGVGGALGHATVKADACKRDGKRCMKHGQCCSGLCVPEPTAGSTSTSESVCCTPESNDLTCAGKCGQIVVNNCGQSIQCGKCGDEICLTNTECASGECCEGTCCDETQPDTYVCCGPNLGCCDCFDGQNGPFCHAGEEICGTYPNDEICAASLTCFQEECVRPQYLCPFEAGGEDVFCTGATGAGCCLTAGGPELCCPHDRPICTVDGCKAVQACSYPDNMTCDYGTCTANQWETSGTCCTNIHPYFAGNDGEGNPVTLNDCCGTDERWDPNCHCNPIHFENCGPPTSRPSYPRVG